MYFSMHSSPPSSVALVARGVLPRRSLLAAMQAAVRAVDPSQAVFHVRTMDEVFGASIAARRTNTLLISLYAGLALLLAALGVYAVVANGLAQRQREFGIRAALGATGPDLVRLMAREMAGVTAIGLATGLAAAWGLSRVAQSLLYGVSTHDPITVVIVPIVLLIPTILATIIPARRVLRVNPAEVMRTD
jgi:putative ABC transport system permease protein